MAMSNGCGRKSSTNFKVTQVDFINHWEVSHAAVVQNDQPKQMASIYHKGPNQQPTDMNPEGGSWLQRAAGIASET